MSRFTESYEEEWQNQAELWSANLRRCLAGKRGQRWLREAEAALLALPEHRLLHGVICREGEVCLVGAIAAKRLADGDALKLGYGDRLIRDLDGLMAATHTLETDWETADFAASALGMPRTLAFEMVYQNDEVVSGQASPEERWEHALAWVRAHIEATSDNGGKSDG